MLTFIKILILNILLLFVATNYSFANPKPILVKSNKINGSIMAYVNVKDGLNKSPKLQWQNPEMAKTISYTIICYDKDAPMGPFYHWLIFNIPKNTQILSEGQPKLEKLSNGALQGKNNFGQIGYDGPAPPPGKVHHYYFIVIALDKILELQPGCTYIELAQAFQKHVLASGAIMFEYFR